jgi:hypothetical protein
MHADVKSLFVSDVLLDVWRTASNSKWKLAVSTRLLGIVRHHAYSALRRRRVVQCKSSRQACHYLQEKIGENRGLAICEAVLPSSCGSWLGILFKLSPIPAK